MSLVHVVSSYSGIINNTPFTGHGNATLDMANRTSDVIIHYRNFPLTFTSMCCKSWKCKKHKLFIDNGLPESYNVNEVIRYSGAATGVIHTAGTVRPGGPDTLVGVDTFDGVYDGPVDAEEILTYSETHELRPDGLVAVTGTRETRMADQSTVIAEWTGLVTPLGPVGPGLSQPVTMEYEFLAFSWQNDGVSATLTKQLRVTVI